METTELQCVVAFGGASAKYRPFRGWGGSVVEWEEKAAPHVDFGKWLPTKGCLRNSGEVVFKCQPFQLVLFGANSKEMDQRDKTTQFGFVGLDVEGVRVALLPKGADAQQVFLDGWKTPSFEEVLAKVNAASRLDDLADIQSFVAQGFGMAGSADFSAVARFWAEKVPSLQAIQDTLFAKKNELTARRAEVKKRISDERRPAVQQVIIEMHSAGVEVSIESVAERLAEAGGMKRHPSEIRRDLRKNFIDCFQE